MTRISLAIVLALSVFAGVQSQTGDPMLARIRTEGTEHSQVAPVFEMLTVNRASTDRVARAQARGGMGARAAGVLWSVERAA